jgi:enoyl-CoA hydratase
MSGIRIEHSGLVLSVTLDIPPVNALTLHLYTDLRDAFRDISKRTDAHCVVLTGSGKVFCAGLDLKEFSAAKVEDDGARALIVRETFAAIRHCALPVIAAVNGAALGAGAVLAAISDIRIASDRATFAMPEINVGRCGGGAHIGRLVGQGALRQMAFTGEQISAAEAYRIGLVEQVVPARRLLPTAWNLAEYIAAKSPIGLRMMKEALNRIETMPVDEGYALEQAYSTRLMATEDAREATRAALEKRPPVFNNR